MRLSEYLQRYEVTQKSLAKQIGVTQGRISQLAISGRMDALERALDLLDRIERATNGKVTAKDFLRRKSA